MHEIPPAERALGDTPQPRSALERLAARLALAACVMLSVATTSAARADVVYIPDAPTDCPEGSTGVGSRRGSYCEWRRCEGSCYAGERVTCSPSEVPLCVRVEELPRVSGQDARGRHYDQPAETRHVVLGPCGPAGVCAAGRCERSRVCVPISSPNAGPAPSPTPPPAARPSPADPAEASCACVSCSPRASRRAALPLLLVTLGLVARRRSRLHRGLGSAAGRHSHAASTHAPEPHS